MRCGDEAAHQDEGEGIQREAKLPCACGIQKVRCNRQACTVMQYSSWEAVAAHQTGARVFQAFLACCQTSFPTCASPVMPSMQLADYTPH